MSVNNLKSPKSSWSTINPLFNGIIWGRGFPILPNVRIPHKHVWRILPILILQSILTFVLHSGLSFSFIVHGVLIKKKYL
jgi:hypothetical protein